MKHLLKKIILFVLYPNWRIVKTYPAEWVVNGQITSRGIYLVSYSENRNKYRITFEGSGQDSKDHIAYNLALQYVCSLNIKILEK